MKKDFVLAPKSAFVCISGVLLALSLASPTWGENPRAVLVQEKQEPSEMEGPVSFATGRVQLLFPEGRAQLLPYRSHFPPLVSGDRVFILPTQGGNLTGIIIYHLKPRPAQSFPLPPDLHPYFGSPSFSPDGTRVAYYALAGQQRGQVRVRSWPGWQLIRQSPVLPLRATDVPPGPPLWKTEALVEFDAQFFDPPRRLSLALPD